jgi:hypothetical protein
MCAQISFPAFKTNDGVSLGDLDSFFELLNHLGDSSRKRALFWPLQTMLLIITPYSLKNDIHMASSKVDSH